MRSPLDELVDERRDQFEVAVDELDIAVALESEGLNDAVAVARYGVADVHELAAELMDRVPTTVPPPNDAGPAELPIPYARLVLRGLLFALPGVFYLTLAKTLGAQAGTLSLLIAILSGWAASQAVAVVAYRMLERTSRGNVTRMLRRCLAYFLLAAAAAVTTGLLTAGVVPISIIAGQLVYVTATTVLLFHDADRWLMAALAPGLLVCAAYLTDVHADVHADGWPLHLAAGVATAAAPGTVGLVLIAAWFCERPRAAGAEPGPYQPPTAAEFARSAPFVLYGLLSALLVAVRPILVLIDPQVAAGSSLDATILPLVLGMGYAEVELHRLTRSARRLSRRTDNLGEYASGVRWLLLKVEVRFALLVALLSAGLAGILYAVSELRTGDIVRLAAYAVVGCAFSAGLVLMAIDRVVRGVLAFVAALATVAALALPAALLPLHWTPDYAYLAGALVVALFMHLTARRAMASPVHFL